MVKVCYWEMSVMTLLERFEALVKRALEPLVVKNPPIFPFEQGVQKYPDTVKDADGGSEK